MELIPKGIKGYECGLGDGNKLWVREGSMGNSKEGICFPDSKERQQKL